MRILPVSVDSIHVGERHRALSDDAVTRLMASIKEIGLQQPITVRIVDVMEIDGEQVQGVPILVAGRHRLEAFKRLSKRNIDCIEVADDALRAELWEIDENLMRAELSPAQRADHLSRRKEIWEALQTAQNPRSFEGRGNKGFVSDASAKTGTPKRTVQVHIARAEALGEDIATLAGTSLDKGVELDALAKMSAEERAPIIADAKAGKAVSARNELSAAEALRRQVDALRRAWAKASKKARAQFLSEINEQQAA
jgi:ParB-like chromosome segregation protein Spo0J